VYKSQISAFTKYLDKSNTTVKKRMTQDRFKINKDYRQSLLPRLGVAKSLLKGSDREYSIVGLSSRYLTDESKSTQDGHYSFITKPKYIDLNNLKEHSKIRKNKLEQINSHLYKIYKV
jgi:hypothetical protein